MPLVTKKELDMLKPWREQYKADCYAPDTQRLVNLCSFDLYFGPIGVVDDEGVGWPGFEASLPLIQQALEGLPSKLWVDSECPECWRETEPEETETCYACDGKGPEEGCNTCSSTGVAEAFLENWYCFKYRDLVRVLLGRELAEYF